MKNTFKIIILFLVTAFNISAQDVTTVEAKSTEISDNLDLKAIAQVFGESSDLEDFERRLNDPDMMISNLDLNEDGYVDYLRVIESRENKTHLILIQAVLAEDIYQDVATIDVEKDESGNTNVQVVGDEYLYGSNYIITPVYYHQPLILSWFWSPNYSYWYSPYHYTYYPVYYRRCHPVPVYRYHQHINVRIDINNSFKYTDKRYSRRAVNIHYKYKRNDYAKIHPDKSFAKRHSRSSNRYEYDIKRRKINYKKSTATQENKYERSDRRKVDQSWSNRNRSVNKSSGTDNSSTRYTTYRKRTGEKAESVNSNNRNLKPNNNSNRNNSGTYRNSSRDVNSKTEKKPESGSKRNSSTSVNRNNTSDYKAKNRQVSSRSDVSSSNNSSNSSSKTSNSNVSRSRNSSSSKSSSSASSGNSSRIKKESRNIKENSFSAGK